MESFAILRLERFFSFLASLVHLIPDSNISHSKKLFWNYALRVRISQQQTKPF
jgi:hypothetical protein